AMHPGKKFQLAVRQEHFSRGWEEGVALSAFPLGRRALRCCAAPRPILGNPCWARDARKEAICARIAIYSIGASACPLFFSLPTAHICHPSQHTTFVVGRNANLFHLIQSSVP